MFRQDVMTIVAVMLGVWVVLYLIYLTRRYPGGYEQPPHYIAATVAFFVGVAVLLAALYGLRPVGDSNFDLPEAIETFSIVMVFGFLAVVGELARRWWRRMRHTRNRQL